MAENDFTYNFSPNGFKTALDQMGVTSTTMAVFDTVAETIPDLSYENFKDGTFYGFNELPDGSPLKDMTPEERAEFFSGEDGDYRMLPFVTNVQDFGLYTDDGGAGAVTRNMLEKSARTVLPGATAAAGATIGLTGTSYLANFIPPVNPFLVGGRLALQGIGLLSGMMIGDKSGRMATDAIAGPEAPVVPELQPSRNMAETMTYYLTGMAQPWLVPGNAKTGAVDFLDNFASIASGAVKPTVRDGTVIAARELGVTAKQAQKALAAKEAVQVGPMLGNWKQRFKVLDPVTRQYVYNPAGYVFNPIKGPASMRATKGLTTGLTNSFEAARQNPAMFLGLEGLMGTLSGFGANLAEQVDPGDSITRAGFEIAAPLTPAAALFPALQLASLGKTAGSKIWQGLKSYAGRTGATDNPNEELDLLQSGQAVDGSKRLLDALTRISVEYSGADGTDGLGEAGIETLIDALINYAPPVDADGRIIKVTVAQLAESMGLPYNKTLKNIEIELGSRSDEMSMAADNGRDFMLQRAKEGIFLLQKQGTPEAMQAAAFLQNSVFQQNILENTEVAVNRVLNAAKQVTKTSDGDELTADLNQVQLGRALYDVMINQVAASKTRMNALYELVGDDVITKFTDAQGLTQNVPNVVKLLNTSSKNGGLKYGVFGRNAEIFQAMGRYKDDFDGLATYFGATPPSVEAVLPSKIRLDESIEKLYGGFYQGRTINREEGNPVTNLVESLRNDGASLDDIVAEMRSKAGYHKGLKDDNNKRLSDAFEKQRTFLLAQRDSVANKKAAAGQQGTADLSAFRTAANEARDAFDLANSGDRTLPETAPRSAVNLEQIIRRFDEVPLNEFDDFVEQSVSVGAGPLNLRTPVAAAGDDYLRAQGALIKAQRTADAAPTVETDIQNPATIDNLRTLRESMMSISAKFRNENPSLAKDFDKISNALLLDINGAQNLSSAEYNTARAYAAAHHTFFSRSFYKPFSQRTKDRGLMMDPSQMAKKFFQGGPTETVQRINQILNATDFLRNQPVKAGGKTVQSGADVPVTTGMAPSRMEETGVLANRTADGITVIDSPTVQGAMLDLVSDAAKVVLKESRDEFGDVSFVVNEAALKRYRSTAGAKELFQVFPQFERDLSSLQSAQQLFDQNALQVAKAKADIDTKAFTSVLANMDAPSLVVATALTSGNVNDAVKQLDSYVTMINNAVASSKKQRPDIKEGGIINSADPDNPFSRAEAMTGLRKALLDQSVVSAGGTSAFSPIGFQKVMFDPIKRTGSTTEGASSLSDWMVKNNLWNPAAPGREGQIKQRDNVQQLIREMKNVRVAFSEGDFDSALFKNPTPASMFSVSMMGATLGQKSQEMFNKMLTKIGIGTEGGGIGGGIVAAGEGKKVLTSLLFTGKETFTVQKMVEIMSDPRTMGLMLRDLRKDNAENIFAAINTRLNKSTMTKVRRTQPTVARESGEEDPVIAEPKGPSLRDKIRKTLSQSYSNNLIDNFFESIGDAVRTDIYTGQERSSVKPPDYTIKKDGLRGPRTHFRQQSSLQPSGIGALPLPAGTAASSGVQTASVDSAGSGISSIDINKARQIFPNDITFAARGGEIRSGIGGLFR